MSLFDVNLHRLSREELVEHCHKLEAALQAQQEHVEGQEVANVTSLLRLTKSEATVLLTLLDGRLHSKEHLLSSLYGGRGGDEPEIRIIDVFICKIRHKLAGSGIVIETLWGRGYRLTNPEALRDVMAGFAPEWNHEDTQVRVGRPDGFKESKARRPAKRIATLKWIDKRAGADGIAEFYPDDLRADVGFGAHGSTALRNLERKGLVAVLSARRTQPASKWAVKLTDAGRELVA